MVQTIYSLLAIVLVMFLSLNLMRIVTSNEQRMIFNEVATQVTGLTVDLMEHVGNRSFDEVTKEDGINPAAFPLVTNPSQLKPENSFGGCTAQNFYSMSTSCDDLDDFDGVTISRSVEGLDYTATIDVRYVSENDPDAASGTSYAKEVEITVTSPNLLIAGDPLEVKLSRVFVYKRITSTPAPIP